MRRSTFGCGLFLVACTTDPAPVVDEDRRYAVVLETDEDEGAFLSVWGTSPRDAWAVGGQVPSVTDAGVGLAYHRDNDGWSAAELPPNTALLNWVHGNGHTTWTVGNAGTALLREDGTWQASETGVDVSLWGVFVTADDDVWAVGGDAFVPSSAVILHYDGARWTQISLPPLDRELMTLFKVWATSRRDVWAVGDNGVILHYDGGLWSQSPTETTRDLISVWGTGPDDVVAVGGRDIGVVARWDGETWTTTEYAALPGLSGVWVNAAGVAVMVGNMGTAAWLSPDEASPVALSTGAGERVLHGIIGFEGGTRYAVGGSIDRNPPYVGVIVETDD